MRHTPCHAGHDRQTGGNGCTLKVFGFAGRVFGERRNGNVEAGEAGEAAEDEEGEEEGVEGAAEAEGEGGDGRRDAKGDLLVS